MADREIEVVFIGSDNLVEIRNLRDEVAGVLLEGAAVTARVLDAASGDPVAGVPDPVAFVEVSGFKGLYRGVIPDAATLTVGQRLKIEITADGGAGKKRRFVVEARAREED